MNSYWQNGIYWMYVQRFNAYFPTLGSICRLLYNNNMNQDDLMCIREQLLCYRRIR